jgi:Asp-tRNA(Asn)/Glu-tRNA(Gln) amidotransferase A subunit family amidase
MPRPRTFGVGEGVDWPVGLGGALAETSDPTAPPRLGLVEEFFVDGADALVREAFGQALERLRSAGAQIRTVGLPAGFDQINTLHGRIMAVEAAAYHRDAFAAQRSQYGPLLTGLLDEGLTISGVDYAAALAHQRHWRATIGPLFDGVDALIMPSTDTPAPPTLTTTGNKRNQAP